MTRDWKLTAEELQELLLVRKVIISPLIGDKLENKDEASESAGHERSSKSIEDSKDN
ncbi:MAG: hypothetical protein DHS20C09_18250 [marine bacterium B5-7]|nr:MAG: hypothetical protein DHS20C09_18250 [marine bacterium B5-7]